MRKKVLWSTVCILAVCLFAVVAWAAVFDVEDAKKEAEKILPTTAEFSYSENDSDEFELHYKDTAEPVVYSVSVSKYMRIVKDFKTRYINEMGSTSVVLTADQASQIVQNLYPDAAIRNVHLDSSDGLKEYEVKFSLTSRAGARGEVEINPETGAVIETKIEYYDD